MLLFRSFNLTAKRKISSFLTILLSQTVLPYRGLSFAYTSPGVSRFSEGGRIDTPGKNYYAEEKLADTRYFTAVYADVAVANACISCHNAHKDSPRNDFKMGAVMGGIVVRIPLGS